MDIKQGDIGLLMALDALLEHESVSAAAAQLGISQPAMSAQLKRLRQLFNDPLLTPSGRRLVATSRARRLQTDLRRNLQDLDALVRENNAFDPATARNTFRLVGTDYVHALLGPKLEERMRRLAPNARLAFLAFEPKTLWMLLENDTVDLALATGMSLPDAMSRTALAEQFCVIMRRDHPLSGEELTLEAFCAARHVLVSPEGGGFVGAADKALARHGLKRQVSVSLPSFLLAPALVAQSDAFCLIPRRLAERYKDIVVSHRPPLNVPGFDVTMLWHPRRQNDPAHMWFRGEVGALTKSV
ncbi:LysR family transcriptional regulator [Roseibium sp. MMSF_3544]|uniref:LysR family transcriptional regulator n=1 Tax=unclassified Roseibium TaxID=2629323 RepID=UPI00273D9A56|nr:LysR family transcriptional regulator [Roseibium sp. MMSF_3544]